MRYFPFQVHAAVDLRGGDVFPLFFGAGLCCGQRVAQSAKIVENLPESRIQGDQLLVVDGLFVCVMFDVLLCMHTCASAHSVARAQSLTMP